MPTQTLPLFVRHLRRRFAETEAAKPTDLDLLGRFAGRRDEEAFAVLVARHGPRVLSVCRGILGHAEDAEDVFQATFLVLARKAGAVPWQESVGGWLCEVAARLSREERSRRAAREARERRTAGATPHSHDVDLSELCAVLHEELLALPREQREVVLRCHLDGRTRDQVADELGWSLRTVERRLQEGRELLRARLLRRGVTLSAALLAASVAGGASAAVPSSLLSACVGSAVSFAERGVAPGLSSRVVEVAGRGLEMAGRGTKAATRLALLTVTLLTAGLLAIGAASDRPGDPERVVAAAPAPVRRAAPTDLERLQGEWRLTAKEEMGQPVPPDQWKGRRLTIKGDRFALAGQPWMDNCSFQLFPDRNPKGIDIQNLTPVEGENAPWHGIYELNGDTLRVCVSGLGSGKPPTKFATEAGKAGRLFTFERVAPAGKKDHDLIQGRWVVVRKVSDEWELPLAKGAADTVTFKDNSCDYMGIGCDFRLDETTAPKRFDLLVLLPGFLEPRFGVYELNGDRLLLCFPNVRGSERPTKLEAPKGSKVTLFELKREVSK